MYIFIIKMIGINYVFLLSAIFYRKLTVSPKVYTDYQNFTMACTPSTPTPSETECKGRGVYAGSQCCFAVLNSTNTCLVVSDKDANSTTYKCPGAYVDPVQEAGRKCQSTIPKANTDCTSIKVNGYSCCRFGYSVSANKVDIC